jgi:hypothetical protein
MIWDVPTAAVCCFTFVASAFKYKHFATNLKACSVVKMQQQVWQNARF